MVARHVRALGERRADIIVLGCTHFHFLRATIEHAAGPQVRVIDPGQPVAAELRRRLQNAQLLNTGPRAPMDRIWTSGDLAAGNAIINRLWPWSHELAPLPAVYCLPPGE